MLPALFSLGILALAGCASTEFATLTIYETPQAYVRLQTNRGLRPVDGFGHPAYIAPDRMAAVLRGIVVHEPLTRMPLYDDLSIPRRHPAFSDEEVTFLAPLLSLALSKATPEEIVTFYRSRPLRGVRREVTSGGLFMNGDDLHFLLSNYRSETHTAADPGVADLMDDRLTPLRALAPQKGTLHFEPEEFRRMSEPQGFAQLFHWDRRELVIRVKELPVAPARPESSAGR